MSSQSRRQRRAIAKQLGYLGKKESVTEFLERTKRSSDFGKQLHTLQLEQNMNYQLENERSKKALQEMDQIQQAIVSSPSDEIEAKLDSEAFTFLKETYQEGPEPSASELDVL